MSYKEAFTKLKQNPTVVYEETFKVLNKIGQNILNDPFNIKLRTLQKSNTTVFNKILSVNGGRECLILMGFEDRGTEFVMDINVSLRKLEEFSKVALTWQLMTSSSSSQIPSTTNTLLAYKKNIKKIVLPPFKRMFSDPFLHKIEVNSHRSFQYEDKNVKLRTKEIIPIVTLEQNAQTRLRNIQTYIKKNKLADPNIAIQDMMILELLRWFKEDFFEWVDKPPCHWCGGSTLLSHTSHDFKTFPYATGAEIYKCKSCPNYTPFVRFDDVNILLETRRGRCGEWANVFTLCCRAMGWDARLVVDEGDHVWTEVYSFCQKRWLHCDPCENTSDSPLMYETGWKKNISYILAYSYEEIQDVTWRYSSNHKEVLKRRNQCTEEALLTAILKIRSKLHKELSQHRKKYLQSRIALELVELLTERKPTEAELKGRTSGSEVWRLARGEIQEESKQFHHVWKINSDDDILGNSVNIRYSSTLNKYECISGEKHLQTIYDWSKGAFFHKEIFRKVENDWKMVYLARTEGKEKGEISWAFDFNNLRHTVDKIILHISYATYANGLVHVQIQNSDRCVSLVNGQHSITTSDFRGCKLININVVFTGGKGDNAWQHAQLFRQSIEQNDYNFSVTFKFLDSHL